MSCKVQTTRVDIRVGGRRVRSRGGFLVPILAKYSVQGTSLCRDGDVDGVLPCQSRRDGVTLSSPYRHRNVHLNRQRFQGING